MACASKARASRQLWSRQPFYVVYYVIGACLETVHHILWIMKITIMKPRSGILHNDEDSPEFSSLMEENESDEFI